MLYVAMTHSWAIGAVMGMVFSMGYFHNDVVRWWIEKHKKD